MKIPDSSWQMTNGIQERVDDDWSKRSETEMQPRVVVRNTFLDIEEQESRAAKLC